VSAAAATGSARPHPERLAIAIALILSAVAARAADAPQQLETVVVTSPPVPVGAEVFSVSQVDGEALDSAAQLDVALSEVPGLSLFRRDSSLSANPSTQGISLRSIAPSGAGRALVTLDGVPLNDPFGNWVIWSALPPEDIGAAQIVRGAGAGPYGAGALTGVVALTERNSEGLAAASAEAGGLGQRRAAAAGGWQLADLNLFASASALQSTGWIPVAPSQRGAADDDVNLNATNASLRGELPVGDASALAVRLSTYNEHRGSGTVGADSSASGTSASITLAHPELAAGLGWRLQAWLISSDFFNRSVSVASNRSSSTPSDDQYATPAIGWGANAAVRGTLSWLQWEAGTDVRLSRGEARDDYLYVTNAFTQERVAGGQTWLAGAYEETAARSGAWLATLGVRADHWGSGEAHLLQTPLPAGTPQVQYPAGQSGIVPSARAGLRREIGESDYVRLAAYSGFRVPSLNELYRPFRLGNNVTLANAALTPERLEGVELGVGGERPRATWDLTLFDNQLRNAITNVTLAQGPGTFAGAGFIPAGGTLIQRENAGIIDALGIEAETRLKWNERYSLRLAGDYVHARVNGGDEAPQLDGLQPAQAPRWTVTVGLLASPWPDWQASVDYRYESLRYADDLNTMNLGSSRLLTVQLARTVHRHVQLFVELDNALNAAIATTESSGVVSYAAPRAVLVGVRMDAQR
jgi:outer membrane receptor protein involved in Fe transport